MFRLRLSNNKLEEINPSAVNPNKIRINSKSAAKANSYALSKPASSRNSSFYYNQMTSRINSISTTPEIVLPVIMNNKSRSRKSSVNKKKKSFQSFQSFQSVDAQDNCSCILCHTNMKQSARVFPSNDLFILDSKNFLNCINRMKPTIKLDREANFSDMCFLGSNIQNSSDFTINTSNSNTLIKIKNNNEVIKLLPAQSRIKLWDPEEVMTYINNEDMKRPIKERRKNNSIQIDYESLKSEGESRLNKIFKEFRLNPNLSPLIYRTAQTATIGFQQVLNNPTNTSVPVPKSMPAPSKTPTSMMYRVPMNSALNMYDC